MSGSNVPYVAKVSERLMYMPGGRTIVRALGKYGGHASLEQLLRGAIIAQFGISPAPFDSGYVLGYLEEHGVVHRTPEGNYELSGIGNEVADEVGRNFTWSLTPRGKEVADELWRMNYALRGINPDRL